MPEDSKEFPANKKQQNRILCEYCQGLGQSHYKDGDWEQALTCPSCGGSGMELDAVRRELEQEKQCKQRVQKDLDNLRVWIKKTSTCSTCKGDQRNTMGGIPCEECGLEGITPWGGINYIFE